MNERIKELAEQAGWGKGHTYDDCMQCSPFDPEKFAELIVQECVAVCWAENGPESGTDAGWYLKEHFDVE